VPGLGDVPLLDWVFANTEEVKETTELLVFVTPTVVDNPDDNDTNYNADERERLRILSKPLAEAAEELEKKRGLTGNDKVPAAKKDEPLKPIDIPAEPAAAPKAAEPAPAGAAPGN
jgi:type II secretory pathway component GspD/PulD (secretin)